VYGVAGDDTVTGGPGEADYCSGGTGFNVASADHGCEILSAMSP